VESLKSSPTLHIRYPSVLTVRRPHLLAQRGGVDQLAVVRHGDAAVQRVDHEGLAVLQLGDAGGGVARVADAEVPVAQLLERLGGEGRAHQAHALKYRTQIFRHNLQK